MHNDFSCILSPEMKPLFALTILITPTTLALPLRPFKNETLEMIHGEATYYTEWASSPGSCGYVPTSKNIVALPAIYMPHSCGKCIRIDQGTKSVIATVTDTCPSCPPGHIDLSDVLFQQLAARESGRISIKWRMVPCPPFS